ncbi:MAG: hypothetical protein PHY05_00145, partial [Methanothrix sp.]|nr:hypothetical protein [Methanothrix sp.]
MAIKEIATTGTPFSMVEAIEGTICELWQGAQTARRVRNDRYFGTYLSFKDIEADPGKFKKPR